METLRAESYAEKDIEFLLKLFRKNELLSVSEGGHSSVQIR